MTAETICVPGQRQELSEAALRQLAATGINNSYQEGSSVEPEGPAGNSSITPKPKASIPKIEFQEGGLQVMTLAR